MFPWILATIGLLQQDAGAWTKEALVVGKDALFLLPAELVCAGEVESYQWSPGGEYLLAKRRIMPRQPASTPNDFGQIQVVAYSLISGRSSTPVTASGDLDVEAMYWITASSKAIVVLRDVSSRREVRWVSVDGSTKVLGTLANDRYPIISSSPTRAQFMVRTTDTEGIREKVEIFDSSARRTAGFEAESRYTVLDFGRDDSLVAAKIVRGGAKPHLVWYTIKPSTGRETEIPDPRRSAPPKPEPAPSEVIAKEVKNVAGSVSVLLETSAGETVLVSGDGIRPQVSPNGQAVAYIHKGVLMVRPILRKPVAFLEHLQETAARDEAISRAKQVAIAMQLYASDMDDALPSMSNWQDEIYPYLKNRKVMDGFVFSYDGGTAKVADPAATMMGYVPGPGGNAITYLDGHVVWTPGPLPKN